MSWRTVLPWPDLKSIAWNVLVKDMTPLLFAKLVSVDKHPDADKLTVCQVDSGTETVQVVCGATNHKSGDLVAFATVGTVLPGDFKIKKSKIRGMESFGNALFRKRAGSCG